MKYFPLQFLLFLLFAKAFCATPVTHVYLAEKWMNSITPFEGNQRSAFIGGNIFPDIRYMGELSRCETHELNLTLEDVYSSKTPFQTGTRLHAYVDERREALVIKWGIYSLIKEVAHGHEQTLLKLIEDELLYDRISSSEAMRDVSVVLQDELDTGMCSEMLHKWHSSLARYFSCRPSTILIILAKTEKPFLGISAETVKIWSVALPQLIKNQDLIDYVTSLDEEFTKDFQQFKDSLGEEKEKTRRAR